MQVNDEIPRLGVVDGRARLGVPGRVGFLVIGIDADDVELGGILELDAAQLRELAPENQVKKLFSRFGGAHEFVPGLV